MPLSISFSSSVVEKDLNDERSLLLLYFVFRAIPVNVEPISFSSFSHSLLSSILPRSVCVTVMKREVVSFSNMVDTDAHVSMLIQFPFCQHAYSGVYRSSFSFIQQSRVSKTVFPSLSSFVFLAHSERSVCIVEQVHVNLMRVLFCEHRSCSQTVLDAWHAETSKESIEAGFTSVSFYQCRLCIRV